MGKKKQQKLYKLNHKKQDTNKPKMAEIIKQLSMMKHQNSQHNKPQDKSTMDLGLYKKKIKKEQKQKKYNAKKQKQEKIEQQPQQVRIEAPKVNIFNVDAYQSGIKTVLNNKISIEQGYSQSKLVDQTKKLMGGDLNFQTFGQKPLRIIEEQEKVELSEDQDQPNTLKNITHSNLQIPQGNYKIGRKNEIDEFRQKLPIFMKQQQIIETINNHLVTLICGQTGCGKSTQIGQFLVQKNYHTFGKIAITQPRRLATIALAHRVAEQTNSKIAQLVGYQVRHQRKDSPTSLIKYLTDGILLNEMSSDYLLKTYSIIVIDEAHERKVNTDILIGLLSRLVLIRYNMSLQGKCHPLRLVIMSATMRVQDFQNKTLFDYLVPIINVEARMFPVTVYFEKQTPEDYKAATLSKCLKIHKKLPEGDVLVFLTGKQEIHEVATMLEQELSRGNYEQSQDENQMVNQEQVVHTKIPQNHLIYCLYSSLPMAQQQAIFKPTPANTRKFIISTNIAQTSITVPNIRYVIDSGQQKHRYHQGVWKWRKGWGSRAMAQQRSGRAGRTTHGYCYRLYSSALYANIMEEYPLPQISKLPLEGVILQLKSIGIPNVYSFPFPTAPEHEKIKNTLISLQQIKSIQGQIGQWSQQTKVTELGKILSFLPLDPKLGKILLMGRKQGVQQHCLLLVILLTVESIFHQEFKPKAKSDFPDQNLKGRYLEQMRQKIKSFKNTYKKYILDGHNGDIFTCINILGDFFARLYASNSGNVFQKIKRQAKDLQLNQNVMRDIYYNTDQIAQIYQTLCNQKVQLQTYRNPTPEQIKSLLDILLCNFVKNTSRLQEKTKYKNRQGREIFIHHLSDAYLRNNLFLACTEFYSSEHGRTYMRFPFPVNNYELLASFGQVNPPNDFVWRNGELVGLATGVIYGWEIPNLFIQSVPQQVRYVYVAKYLLEGKIFQPIKALEKYLKASTSIIKPNSLDYKVQKVIQTLKVHKLWQAGQLLKRWQKDKKFLKEELRVWVQMKNFDEVYQIIRQKIIKSEQN